MNHTEWVRALVVGAGCELGEGLQVRRWRRRSVGLNTVARDHSVTRGRVVCLRRSGGRTRQNRHLNFSRLGGCYPRGKQPAEILATIWRRRGNPGRRSVSHGARHHNGSLWEVRKGSQKGALEVVLVEDGELFRERGAAPGLNDHCSQLSASRLSLRGPYWDAHGGAPTQGGGYPGQKVLGEEGRRQRWRVWSENLAWHVGHANMAAYKWRDTISRTPRKARRGGAHRTESILIMVSML